MLNGEEQFHSFSSLKFEELGGNFDEACRWIGELGCAISATRVNAYKKDLSYLIANYQKPTEDNLLKEGRLETALNSMYEATELISIYRGLSSHSCNTLLPKLKEMASGPTNGTDENPANSSNRPRNTAFELITAARLLSAGYGIDLTTDADIIASKDEETLFVECKRPQSSSGINSNLKGALKQLTTRYQSSSQSFNARGVVALSINKAVPEASKILNAATSSSAGRTLASVIADFQTEHQHRWRNVEDKRTIGLWLDFSAPVVLKTERMLTIGRHTGFHVLLRAPEDELAMLKLAKSLREVAFL